MSETTPQTEPVETTTEQAPTTPTEPVAAATVPAQTIPAPAVPKPTKGFEEWAKAKGHLPEKFVTFRNLPGRRTPKPRSIGRVPTWQLAGMKAMFNLPAGKEMTEAEFDASIAKVENIQIGGSTKKPKMIASDRLFLKGRQIPFNPNHSNGR